MLFHITNITGLGLGKFKTHGTDSWDPTLSRGDISISVLALGHIHLGRVGLQLDTSSLDTSSLALRAQTAMHPDRRLDRSYDERYVPIPGTSSAYCQRQGCWCTKHNARSRDRRQQQRREACVERE